MHARNDTYPRHLANRLEPGIGYDVVFVHDLDGAIAVRAERRSPRRNLPGG